MKKIIIFFSVLILLSVSAAASFAELQPCDLPPSSVPIDITQDMFTNHDKRTEYSADAEILFDGDSCTVQGKGAEWDGEKLRISLEGCYLLSGKLSDGQIRIAVDPASKIQLVLENTEINSTKSAAILIESADKVFITTAPESSNVISSAAMKDEKIDAAIYSDCDLTFNGNGALRVSCRDGHGIYTKDDLKICSGNYDITAHKQGLSGKDSVRICGGNIKISSERDAIHSEHTKSSKGFVFISGGELEVHSEKDGISATGPVTIVDGHSIISSGVGKNKENSSRACIRSETSFTMYGGTLELSTPDEIVRCSTEPQIKGGKIIF